MKRFFATKWALVIVFAIFIAASGGVAHAVDSHPYTLFYPDDAKTVSDLKKAAQDGGIGDNDANLLKKTFLYSKGTGIQPNPTQLKLNAGASNDHDMPIYTVDYYCSPTEGNKVTTTKPSDDVPYVRLTWGVALLESGNWKGLVVDRDYKTYVGFYGNTNVGSVHFPEKIDNDTSSTESTAQSAKDFDIRGKDGDNDIRPNFDIPDTTLPGVKYITNDGDYTFKSYNASLGSNEDVINQCRVRDRENVGNKTSNYQKLSDDDKADWDSRISAAGWGSKAGESTSIDGEDDAETGTNCQGGGMGWLFCPMIQAMASTVQLAAGLIDSLMQVRFLAQEGPSKQVETAWRAFLSVANIALVVAFMFIIFSQATSAGLSNYGIKRMLPRLIIAAILMNLSFYICALAIDMSNILGSSIMGFLVGSGGDSVASSITAATGGPGAASVLGWIAAGIAIIALAFFLFIPVVLSIILVLVVLIGRQVVLMCLVLISPLAFVAWLLPNTEQWFKKWYESFFQMLILYPIIMLMFGASLYLSNLMGSPDLGTSIIGG